MKIGICQTDIVREKPEHNLLVAKHCIELCSQKGARLVLFPEMSFTGYYRNPKDIACDYNGGYFFNTISGYTEKYGVYIGFGFVGLRDEKFYNRYEIVAPDGRIVCDYNKIHPFSYDGEDEFYTSGDELKLCEIDGVKVCPLICYDLRFPEIFQVASEKADLIVVPANWGGRRKSHWDILLPARAVENQCYIAGINRVGTTDDNFYAGNSALINPMGEVVERLGESEGYVIANVDRQVVTAFRESFPAKKDRKPKLYRDITCRLV